MAQEVRGIATGEARGVPTSGPIETRALADAVNQMATDIAARVDALRAEIDLREQILSTMSEGVILTDEGTIVYANSAARALLGAQVGHVLAPTVPVDRDATVEIEVHHPARRDLRTTTTRLPDGRALIVGQDITETKRLDAMRRDFVANASHEMKTPVAGILATAETLQHAIEHDPQSAQRFALTLASEARRLSDLITDLLSLARLEEPLDAPNPVDLSAVVEASIGDAADRCAAGGVTFGGARERSVFVRGRVEDLRLLIRNLVDNAIRYTLSGGDVDVSLRANDEDAELVVRDTGVGIPIKDLPRVFERFFRVDQARARATGGTGLGLAIVRHVAETHGGSVSVESQLGSGSTFTVRIPLARY